MLREGRAEAEKNRDGRAEEGVRLIGDECVEDARKKPETSSRQRPRTSLGGCCGPLRFVSLLRGCSSKTYLIVLSPIPVCPLRALTSHYSDLVGRSMCKPLSSRVLGSVGGYSGGDQARTRRALSWTGAWVGRPLSCTSLQTLVGLR